MRSPKIAWEAAAQGDTVPHTTWGSLETNDSSNSEVTDTLENLRKATDVLPRKVRVCVCIQNCTHVYREILNPRSLFKNPGSKLQGSVAGTQCSHSNWNRRSSDLGQINSPGSWLPHPSHCKYMHPGDSQQHWVRTGHKPGGSGSYCRARPRAVALGLGSSRPRATAFQIRFLLCQQRRGILGEVVEAGQAMRGNSKELETPQIPRTTRTWTEY